MPLQDRQLDHVEGADAGRGQHDRRRYSGGVRLKPPLGDNTPAIARLQPDTGWRVRTPWP